MAITITVAMNGRIPAGLLAAVPFQPGMRLASDAAASLGRLNAAVEAAHGWSLYLTSAYRTVAEQNALKAQGLTSVSGGSSEHGLARAGDLGGLGGQTGTRYAQLAALAGEHGWYQPAWAVNGIWKNGRQIQAREPWHWEYDPARDTHLSTPSEEDDMPYKPNELAQITIDALSSDLGKAAIVAALATPAGKKVIHDQADLALREQLAPSGEAHRRLIGALPAAVLAAKVSDDTGTLAQTVRDSRRITRRLEAAWRKVAGLPADPTQEP